MDDDSLSVYVSLALCHIMEQRLMSVTHGAQCVAFRSSGDEIIIACIWMPYFSVAEDLS